MVYQWKTAAQIKIDAQTAGLVCDDLAKKGALTAKNLLEVSRPENAPLHGAFEWDDCTAAEKYREGQARHVINSLVIVPNKAEPVRAFFNIEHQDARYHSICTIIQSPSMKENLLRSARKELASFREKYASIVQFAKLFEAIDEVLGG